MNTLSPNSHRPASQPAKRLPSSLKKGAHGWRGTQTLLVRVTEPGSMTLFRRILGAVAGWLWFSACLFWAGLRDQFRRGDLNINSGDGQ